MSQFSYTAVDTNGKRHEGTLDADNVGGVSQVLTKQGLRPIIIKKASQGNDVLAFFTKRQKVKLKDIVIFTRQLATMIDAGVPIVKSLATLQNQSENPVFKKHLQEISKDIESGTSFADALEKHSKVFSPIYINMVRAGEAGGILDDILKKLALQQEKDARIRGKFKSAMTYPAVLVGITAAVFVGLMTIVVPKISKIVADLSGGKLPPLTQAMQNISSVIINYWYIHVIILVGGTIFIGRALQTDKGRLTRDKLLLSIPAIKIIVIKMTVARFSRIFASLMTAGVGVIESIEITSKAIGNKVIEAELMSAAKDVANGEQFSVPLSKSKYFPPIVSQMLAVGEETGKTDSVLIKVAEFYEDEVDVAVDSLSSILEPLLIVIMGGMVGLIAVSVIGPISNLSNQI
ncbi:type II secretion system F family protein [bacterium]|nr:type II secretion system F family protein [bacterium]NBX97671.1 type II secretion system F family protein [bacterium]NDC94144.1 type II secretion system F family protein [bacterium]NDD83141.1 type II secretion system F family protein [bacterium]NDG29364.1 type II secretion system F family protein [bacterium]